MSVKLSDKDIKELSFEESFKYLEEIISSLETGEAKLEDSIILYEIGIKLKNHCEEKLKSSELRIKKVLKNHDIEKFDG